MPIKKNNELSAIVETFIVSLVKERYRKIITTINWGGLYQGVKIIVSYSWGTISYGKEVETHLKLVFAKWSKI